MALIVTRFAPSTTGYLHIGHALSAWWCAHVAETCKGVFRLRLEDLDNVRSGPIFEAAILDDLAWLGLRYKGSVVRQSERTELYKDAMSVLAINGLAYPCFCSRKDIARLKSERDAGGARYPGTCRELSTKEQDTRKASGKEWRWRLNTEAAWQDGLFCTDIWGHTQPVLRESVSDIALTSRGIGNQTASYHLASVVDDAEQGITCITRGEDLRFAAPIHRLLQKCLGYTPPLLAHHPLIMAPNSSEKLSKSKRPDSIRDLKAQGFSPQDVLEHAKASVILPPLSNLVTALMKS